MAIVDELQSSIQSAAAAGGRSVVGIGSHLRGSGVVVAPGRVLTNAHNIRGNEVTVHFAGERTVRGHLAGFDGDGDLAVIEVETGDAPPATWGEPESLQLGSAVFGAAATPGGAARVTFGTVSALSRAFRGPGGRRIAGSIEHTAPLAPGSSGGALLDAAGRLVGLNTNRLGEGFYLALPADEALRRRVEALGRGETVDRPRLGVAVAPAFVARRLRRSVGLPERDGLLVREVEAGSPAERAGIAAGDLIVAVGETAVTDGDQLVEAIAAATPPYEVRLVRGTEERTVTVGGQAQATGEA